MKNCIKTTVQNAVKTLFDKPGKEEGASFSRELAQKNRGRLVLLLPVLILFFGINLLIDVLLFHRQGITYFLYLDSIIVTVSIAFLLFILLSPGDRFRRFHVILYIAFLLAWAAVLAAFQQSMVTLFIIAFMAGVSLYIEAAYALGVYTLRFFTFYITGRFTGAWYSFSTVEKIELAGILFWSAAATRVMLLSKLREFRYRTRLEDLTKHQEEIIGLRTADLEERLTEREILIKEIHHRVKNNLQILVSLSNLSIDFMYRQPPEQLLRENRDRVISMALAHECIYNSGSLASVSMKSYLSDLLYGLIHSDDGADRISTRIEVEEWESDLDSAIQVGLVVTEILTAIISNRRTGREPWVLGLNTYSADGDMFLTITAPPEQLRPNDFGLLLINSITGQLEGSYSIEEDGRFIMTVPKGKG